MTCQICTKRPFINAPIFKAHKRYNGFGLVIKRREHCFFFFKYENFPQVCLRSVSNCFSFWGQKTPCFCCLLPYNTWMLKIFLLYFHIYQILKAKWLTTFIFKFWLNLGLFSKDSTNDSLNCCRQVLAWLEALYSRNIHWYRLAQ